MNEALMKSDVWESLSVFSFTRVSSSVKYRSNILLYSNYINCALQHFLIFSIILINFMRKYTIKPSWEYWQVRNVIEKKILSITHTWLVCITFWDSTTCTWKGMYMYVILTFKLITKLKKKTQQKRVVDFLIFFDNQ